MGTVTFSSTTDFYYPRREYEKTRFSQASVGYKDTIYVHQLFQTSHMMVAYMLFELKNLSNCCARAYTESGLKCFQTIG